MVEAAELDLEACEDSLSRLTIVEADVFLMGERVAQLVGQCRLYLEQGNVIIGVSDVIVAGLVTS